MFRLPIPIDRSKSVRVDVPDAWKQALDGPTIEVLPLVEDRDRKYGPGWCTYVYEHVQAPELEVFCGGINSKTPKAGAIWRQGNLLHFGFEQSPGQLNENGRATLVNAIVYISRFVDDRPIVRTPCVFVGGKRLFDRDVVGRLVGATDRGLTELKYYLSDQTYASVKDLTREELGEWFASVRDYLYPDEQGKLTVDEEAQKFGVPPATHGFLDKAIASLTALGEGSAGGRAMLVRYVPDGPGLQAPADQWSRWHSENRPYLFFSDTGGYRWYIDPLAKARGIPTESLRGPARASSVSQRK